MALGLDGGEGVAVKAHAEVVELDAARRGAAERRLDRGRPVDELGRGSEHFDLDGRTGQGAQGEDAFDRRNPGAGDEDSCHARTLAPAERIVISASPQVCGEYY